MLQHLILIQLLHFYTAQTIPTYTITQPWIYPPPPPSYGLLPAGMSKGNRRNSTGSRVSFSKDIEETMIYNADSGANSGGQQQQRNGASMRSFYSQQSGAASYDDDDAGDEYDC